MVRQLIALILTLLLLTGSVLAVCGPEKVTFPDPNFEAAMRLAIGKLEDPLFPSDLAGLRSLCTSVIYTSGEYYTNLTGLEHCTNLIEFRLTPSEVNDISPLASLTLTCPQ